jgi:hypothetical protein
VLIVGGGRRPRFRLSLFDEPLSGSHASKVTDGVMDDVRAWAAR